MTEEFEGKTEYTEHVWICQCQHVNFVRYKKCRACKRVIPDKPEPVHISTVRSVFNKIELNELTKGMIVIATDRRILRITDNKIGMIKNVEALPKFQDKRTGLLHEMGSIYGFQLAYMVFEDEVTTLPIILNQKQRKKAEEISKMIGML